MTVAKADRLDEKAVQYREKFGLTFNQWKDLRAKGYTTEQITRAFRAWQKETRKGIEWEHNHAEYEEGTGRYLSAVQAARSLGIGEFLVCNLNHRGKLEGRKLGRRVAYSKEDLLEIVDRDYSQEPSKRSPLAKAFIRWLELRDAA